MPAGQETKPALTGRQIAAVVAGNGLEFYDFITYSFFAVQIGRALFPGDAASSLMLSLATFGVGFVSRPVGGLVIGRLADRKGRKPAMILSFTLMGVAITGLALTPSYALIGMGAPVLAVLFRLIQGFALGGEVGPNAAFLLEAAPPHRRGLYLSMHAASADASTVIAGLIGLALSASLSPAALDAWGWRAAFLIGAAIVPFGLALRRGLGETLSDAKAETEPAGSQRRFPIVAAAGLVILGAATISNYTLDYLATYAQDTLHMATTSAFGAVIVLGLCGVVGDLTSGWLADRYGRKRVLVLPWLALMVLVIPAFRLLSELRTPVALLAATALLTLLHIFGSTPALLLFIEALPARIRAGAMGIIYAVAIALFGGTTQLVVKALIDWTKSPLAPAFYMMAAILFGLGGALLIREPRRVRKSAGVEALGGLG
jgi:MHS family citrate/tricarballylate:H+ symporter-like MFS transporter